MTNTIKRILIRFRQAFRYGYVNIITSLGINKIYITELKFPLFIRVRSSDVLAFHQIFTFKEYGMNLGFTPSFIVDAGANIGLSAIYFSNKFPEATILAIEPERSNFKLLEQNTAFYPKIALEKKALHSQSNIVLDIVDGGYGNWGFVTKKVEQDMQQEVIDQVNTISIDDILIRYNLLYLDVLKIDIEGGEKDLFASNYENWLPKTKCIIIELHDGINKGCSKSFFSAISKYDFSFFNRGENLLFLNNKL